MNLLLRGKLERYEGALEDSTISCLHHCLRIILCTQLIFHSMFHLLVLHIFICIVVLYVHINDIILAPFQSMVPLDFVMVL